MLGPAPPGAAFAPSCGLPKEGLAPAMSPLQSAERELAELDGFLSVELPAGAADDPELRELRARAERLAIRLSNPIRVALVGLPGRGKSTLGRFLSGHGLPAASPRERRYPLILRYGTRAESLAGWWSGIEIPQDGVDMAGAAEHNPDYIEIRLPNPVLQVLSFLDLPGAPDWNAQKEQMRWVSGRADTILWCTNAVDPWGEDEWQLWSLVPRRLQQQSVLVATHYDLRRGAGGTSPVSERLSQLTKGQFREVVAVATLEALAAAPAGQVLDAASWDLSGGKALVGALLSAARAVRSTDLVTARELAAAGHAAIEAWTARSATRSAAFSLRRRAAQHAADPPPPATPPPAPPPAPPVASPPEPAAPADGRGPGDEAPAPAASPLPKRVVSRTAVFLRELEQAAANPQPEEVTGNDVAPDDAAADAPAAVPLVLRTLGERIDDLIAYAADPANFRDWEFMTKVSEIGDELSVLTARPGDLSEDGRWVRREVEEAYVTLSLLQMEHGEKPAQDAVIVLLQLARDLSWAATARVA